MRKPLWFRRLWRLPSRRRLGDDARERREWLVAARHYRTHLSRRPNDWPIWVQLGHALKEAGLRSEALQAYLAGYRLKPDNADLLLSLGHLYKLLDRQEEAWRTYEASATIDQNLNAMSELQRLSLTPSGEAQAQRPDPALLEHMQTITSAVVPLDAHALVAEQSGWIQSTGFIPWITLAFQPATDARLIELTIDVGVAPESPPLHDSLWLDYGSGFAEQPAIRFPQHSGSARYLIALPSMVTRLRWCPTTIPRRFRLDGITLIHHPKPASAYAYAPSGPSPSATAVANRRSAIRCAFELDRPSPADAAMLQLWLAGNADPGQLYGHWLHEYVEPDAADYRRIAELTATLLTQPRFSFIVPIYNTPVALLRACIDSLLAQTYRNFEICLADDCSTDPAIAVQLNAYAAQDDRIRVCFRDTNGHISAASNSALALASGDFVVLVDHDDVIPDYTLFVVADAINQRPDASVFFSDEDKIDLNGVRHSPYFKTEFNRFLVYGHNMVSHLGVYKRTLVDQIGGFRAGLEGSQDYDLFLRCYEVIGDTGVVHIPHVLYHWRTTPGSTAIGPSEKSYALTAAKHAINDHFHRTATPLRCIDGIALGTTAIIGRSTYCSQDSISIIIPTRDRLDLLRPCIESVIASRPTSHEIIVVDNVSTDPEALEFLTRIERRNRVRVLRQPGPFNLSALYNHAANLAEGDVLCFLNNHTQVRSRGWLDRARLMFSFRDVGVVGARLIDQDDVVQNFGLALGAGNDRVAAGLHVGLSANDPGYFGKARLIQQFSAVTAACMLVRREQFLDFGGFDPLLPVAYNDVDLCLRYGAAGFRIICDPDIELTHTGSCSRGEDITPDQHKGVGQEAALMHDRWRSVLDDDPFFSPNHSLDRLDFSLAYPPRVPMPWQRGPRSGTDHQHPSSFAVRQRR